MTRSDRAVFHFAFPILRLAGAALLCAAWTPAFAQQPPDLTTVAFEDLMKVTITSASRREQNAFDTASAVYVISQDEIRRSGLSSVPELLRLAPGVDVARIDTNKWAIAIRGFNFRWSHNLLVLIDGRTIYNRLQSGVFWETVDLPVELIDRIEVVRGPGGSLWGANAVDGVINILTKSANATRGGLFRTGGGAYGQQNGFGQYSGGTEEVAYRVYGQWFDRGHALLPGSRADAEDGSRSGTGGFHVDWTGVRNDVTLQGDASSGQVHTLNAALTGPMPPKGGWVTANHPGRWQTANLFLRWSRTSSEHASVQVQALVEHVHRDDPQASPNDTSRSMELGLTSRTKFRRHNLVSGVAYRLTRDEVPPTFIFSVSPSAANLTTSNVFAQDEIGFLADDRLRLTVGGKLEHDTLGGWSFQPTTRALLKLSASERVWAAWSSAVRTPARVDRSLAVNFASFVGPQGLPVVLGLRGNPEYRSETLRSLEMGYRIEPRPSLSLDVAAFFNHYDNLQSLEPQAPTMQFAAGQPYLFVGQMFGNNQRADARGVEMAAVWRPVPWWQVEGSVSGFRFTPHPVAGTADPLLANADGNVPAVQWQLRTSLFSRSRVSLHVQIFRVGPLHAREVPGYTRADLQAIWSLTKRLSLSTNAQNLFGRGHVEFGGTDNGTTPTLNSRTATAQLTWRF